MSTIYFPSQHPTNIIASTPISTIGSPPAASSTVSSFVTSLKKHQNLGMEVDSIALRTERQSGSKRLRCGSDSIKTYMCISKKCFLLLGIANCVNPFISLLMKCNRSNCCRQTIIVDCYLLSLRIDDSSKNTCPFVMSPASAIFNLTPVQISHFAWSMLTQAEPAKLSSTLHRTSAALRWLERLPSILRSLARATLTNSFYEGENQNILQMWQDQ